MHQQFFKINQVVTHSIWLCIAKQMESHMHHEHYCHVNFEYDIECSEAYIHKALRIRCSLHYFI